MVGEGLGGGATVEVAALADLLRPASGVDGEGEAVGGGDRLRTP